MTTYVTEGSPREKISINPLNAELNPICHLLALRGGATIVVVSRLRVKNKQWFDVNGTARVSAKAVYVSKTTGASHHLQGC